MPQTDLQRLVLRVDANISRYERQLNRMEGVAKTSTKRTERHFTRMSNNVNRQGARFAMRFTAAIAAVAAPAVLARASMATLKYSQELASASDRLGFSIEKLQEYRFAAEQNGIATRALDMGLQRFSRRVAEAAQGTGELRTTLSQYNIEIRNTDGTMRSINDIFRDYADTIQGAENQSEALRLAFKAFDSEGAALVEFLRGGTTALDNFSAAAHDAGIVLDDGLVRRGAEAQAVMDELKSSIGADFNRAVLENVEGLETLAEVLADIATFAVEAGAGIGGFLGSLAESPVVRAPDALSELTEEKQNLQRDIDAASARLARLESGSSVSILDTVLGRTGVEGIRDARFELRALELQMDRLNEASREQLRENITGMLGAFSPTDPGDGVTDSPVARTLTLEEQEAERVAAAAKEQARSAHGELLGQQKADMMDLLQLEADRKRELMLDIARDEADAYLDALEQNREKFVQLFSDTMTNGVRAAFDGNLPEYAARRMQEAFYDRLSRLFDQLGDVIFESGRGKSSGGGGLLSTIVSGAAAIFGGGRASGGPVSANMSYRVGENGPEIFTPGQKGMIVPNQGALTGAGQSGNMTIRLEINEGDMFEARVVEVAGPLAQRATITAVATSRSDMERSSQRQLQRLR